MNNYEEVLSALARVNDLVHDLRFAVQMAEDQGVLIEESIRQHTKLDPNLLGAVLNLSSLLKR